MVRKYRTEKRTEERTYLDEITCDICGRVAKGGDWASSAYEVDDTEIEVSIKHREGYSFPEGGGGEELIVDMCPVCFKEKFVPWLKSQGANPEYKDWYW